MKIEDCIGKRNINGAQLARLTGYHPAYVQRILKGAMEPGVKFLKALESIKFEDIEKRGSYNSSFAKLNKRFNDS